MPLRVANVAIGDPSEAAPSVISQSALMVGPWNAGPPSHPSDPRRVRGATREVDRYGFRHLGDCREDGTLLQQFE